MDLHGFVARIKAKHAEIPPELFDTPLIGDPVPRAVVAHIHTGGDFPLDEAYCRLIEEYGYIDISPGGATLYGIGKYRFSPWFSDSHSPHQRYWVIGDWWEFADGDQFLVDQAGRYFLHLHEDGPEIRLLAENLAGLFDYILSH